MRATLEKRLAALEQRPVKPRPHDQDAWEEKTLTELGLTREQFMEKYGGFPNYSYMKMVTPDGSPPKPLPTKYKTWGEYYLAMIRGEV